MRTRESYTGAHVISLASHRAPNAIHDRRDIDYPAAKFLVGQREGRLPERSPADRSWAAQAGRFHTVQGDRLSHSFSASMQSGSHTSPGLFATVTAGAHGEESPRNSFTQFLIDVMAVFVAITLIFATGVGVGAALFSLIFLSF